VKAEIEFFEEPLFFDKPVRPPGHFVLPVSPILTKGAPSSIPKANETDLWQQRAIRNSPPSSPRWSRPFCACFFLLLGFVFCSSPCFLNTPTLFLCSGTIFTLVSFMSRVFRSVVFSFFPVRCVQSQRCNFSPPPLFTIESVALFLTLALAPPTTLRLHLDSSRLNCSQSEFAFFPFLSSIPLFSPSSFFF